MTNTYQIVFRIALVGYLILFFAVKPVTACAITAPTKVIPSSSTSTPWKRINSGRDICIWSRNAGSNKIRELAAAAFIKAPPVEVANLIKDCGRYPQVFRHMETCIVLRADAKSAWFFQQLSFPGLGADRYFTVDISSQVLNGGIHQVSWSLVDPHTANRRGRGVAVVRNTGFWHLRPVGNGNTTAALYFLSVDPGGNVPKAVANLLQRSALPNAIRDVRRALN